LEEFLSFGEKTLFLKRNEHLTVANKIDTNIYFVKNGSVRAYILEDGFEQNIRFGYKGNLIVAIDSFFTNKPTQFYIQALKKTEVLIIKKEKVDAYVNNALISQKWVAILENLIVQQLDREIDLLTNSPKERFLRVAARSPQLFQEISNKHIANYLRMSPETLSRLKKY
jgi:CRP-like cAMP-binding protein